MDMAAGTVAVDITAKNVHPHQKLRLGHNLQTILSRVLLLLRKT
jgi:hypothetical protein